MKEITSKSGLGIALSQLKGFEKPKVKAEQYPTDAEIAAEILWNAKMLGDIEKVIVDLGCGTGILGMGTLLLGAKKVYFVDNDKESLDIAKSNMEKVKSEYKVEGESMLILEDISEFKIKADVVIENPPFGTKVSHADRLFLEKAVTLAPIIYTFHKTSTKKFIEAFSSDAGFEITHCWNLKFPLKASFEFHRRQIKRIDVSCFRLKSKSI